MECIHLNLNPVVEKCNTPPAGSSGRTWLAFADASCRSFKEVHWHLCGHTVKRTAAQGHLSSASAQTDPCKCQSVSLNRL